MLTLSELVLGLVLHGLPFLIIILSAGIYAARHKSILWGLVAVGCIGIATRTIWSFFAPTLARTHTVQEFADINRLVAICRLAGWYILSIALAIVLVQKRRTPDNKRVELIGTDRAESSP
jgi:hypothetical protein